jgi:glutamate/tyrosine decarboxylase-like PLP-dependent enzyme
MANLIGLTVARNARAGWDVRAEGLVGQPQLTMYGSTEMHSSLQRAVEELGIGSAALRRVAVDAQLRIDVEALHGAIAADRAAGLQPLCIIANVAATNAGSIDPLPELAEIANDYGLWFHVDGAFGALAYLSPDYRPRLQGMELADSLAFDLHKWPYLPFAVGCVLVRDAEAHRRAFTLRPDYLKHGERGPSGGDIWFSDYGLELTRSFKALKVWMAFKTYGTRLMGQMVQQNIDQAAYLAELVERSPRLELLAPVPLNTVCFRFRPDGYPEGNLDPLNEEIVLRLQESGAFVPSSTQINGRFAIRASITNHRTTGADLEALVAEVERTGQLVVVKERG